MVGTQPLIWIVDDSPTQRAIILLAAASAQSSRAREEFGSHEDVLRAAPDFATYARESGMRALAAITTCLELTGLAIATAMRSEADRVEIRFHQEMIGIVSHDLRSPRARCRWIEMLRTGATPKHLDMLGRIDKSTRRM